MTDVRRIPIRDMPKTQQDNIQSLMKAGFIPGISIASVSPNGSITAAALGLANAQTETKVDSDTQFWACSLSKPVFAYLVIKLIADGTLPFFLDEKISHNGKEITPRMMLSHQTGLPNQGPPDSQFNDSKPGEVFRYSGEGYVLLQKIIKERTGKELNALANEKIFEPLGMTRSSFLFLETEPNLAEQHNDAMNPSQKQKSPATNNHAGASLHTTAVDYARFLTACMDDLNFVEMMTPQITNMEKDLDSKEVGRETLKHIDWGLGFGLQRDEKGQVVSAFHWGHGPGARTFFSINLKNNSAVVYLTNSENGMAIAEEIAKQPVGNISATIRFLSEKYGYRSIHSPGWQEYHEKLMAGIAEEKAGNYDQAISAYQEALSLRPDKKYEFAYRIMWAEIQKAQEIPADTSVNLENFIGQYGPLKILSADSKNLQIEVGDPRPHDLKIIDNNTLLDLNDGTIFKINREVNPASLTCNFRDRPPFVTKPSQPMITNAESSLSGTARTAVLLGIPSSDLTPAQRLLNPQNSTSNTTNPSTSQSEKTKDAELTDEEVARSAFGKGSDTVRKSRH